MPTECSIFVTTDVPLTPAQVAELGEGLRKVLDPNSLHDHLPDGGLMLELPEDYHLAPDEVPRSASILSLDLATPYFGPGYERGYWPEIAAALDYLRTHVPAGRVWFGPDTGRSLREVTSEAMARWQLYWEASYTRCAGGSSQPGLGQA